MSGTKRLAAVVLALFLGAGALIGGAATASAKPYPSPPRITCTVTSPPKFIVTCQLTGFLPNKPIKVTLYSNPIVLGTVTVNGAGAGTVSHKVPASFAGHTEKVVGQDTLVASDVAQTHVTFPKSGGGSGTGGTGTGGTGTGGGLSGTGVAVLSIGGAGVLLLAAGGFLVLSGRRRQSLA